MVVSINTNDQTQQEGVKIKIGKNLLTKSSILLITTNLLTLTVAYFNNWKLVDLMFIYWIQSVTIGFFQFKKILNLKKFSTNNFKIGGKQAEPTEATKKFTAYFFLFHYNVFHFGYLTFILASNGIENILYLGLMGISFMVNHYYSYVSNKYKDSLKVKNIGEMMSKPYIRIFPMHLVIIAGGYLKFGSILLFVFLKTFADLLMHASEHGDFQKSKTSKENVQIIS